MWSSDPAAIGPRSGDFSFQRFGLSHYFGEYGLGLLEQSDGDILVHQNPVVHIRDFVRDDCEPNR